MRHLRFLSIGILFGIVMSKSEAISWYRIQEMFLFDSFHMYGIIATAIFWGVLSMKLLKHFKVKSTDGSIIEISAKDKGVKRYLFGGIIFGLGWALAGACPGPMFILIGHGIWAVFIVIGGALAGTFLYGILRPYLPH